MLRRLHHADVRLLRERERAGEKLRFWHEVGIENCDEIRGLRQLCQVPQRIVDVARFRMRVVGAGDVAAAVLGTELLQPLTPAVVADPLLPVSISHSGYLGEWNWPGRSTAGTNWRAGPRSNEEEEILERTIIGALGLDYPNFRLFVGADEDIDQGLLRQ